MSIKISVIIPVYNAEDYLTECLNSVICQTIEEKEILCIDDGSTDGSYGILEQYQRKYSYIKVFRQENKGAGEARNTGILKASGKYVCFLDADDFYLSSDALDKMVCACESGGFKACAGLRKLYKDGLLEDFIWNRNYFQNGKNCQGIVIDYREQPDDYYYTNYIFALDIIKKNKILFPPYRRYEDPPFFLKVMILIRRYIIFPVEFYGYRFPEEALARKETYMEDVLSGIRDNIKIASVNQLYNLEEILVARISLEYVPGIIKNANKKILELLQEIWIMERKRRIRKEITATQTVLLDNIITLAKFKLEEYGIGDYFEEKGITTLAIYGLGRYGKFLIDEVQTIKGITLFGIDQRIKELEGIETGTLEEVNRKCKDIIVTPAKENERIVMDIEKVWKGNVWGWNDLVYQMYLLRELNSDFYHLV